MNKLRDGYHRLIYKKKFCKMWNFFVVEGEGKSSERVRAAYDVFVGISTCMSNTTYTTLTVFFSRFVQQPWINASSIVCMGG